MKKIAFAALAAIVLIGCKEATTSTKTADSSIGSAPVTAVTYDYAYKIEKPDNWAPGDQQHVVKALKALKAFEDNDMTTSLASFGDSVKLELDG